MLKKIILITSFLTFSCNSLPYIPKGCSDLEFYLTYEVPSENIKEENVTYQNGIKYTGRCSVYCDSGELASIQQYIDGKDHGKWVFYYPNGQVETKGKFKIGKRVGTWKYYFEDGQIKQISKYKEGLKNGTWKFYSEEGELIIKEKWYLGQFND